MIGRESIQVPVQRLHHLPPGGLSSRSGAWIRRIPPRGFIVIAAGAGIERECPALSPSVKPSFAILDLIVDDAAKPRPKLGLSPKLVNLAKTEDKDFLGNVVGLLMILEAIQSPAPDTVLKVLDEAPETLLVSALRRLDPLLDLGFASSRHPRDRLDGTRHRPPLGLLNSLTRKGFGLFPGYAQLCSLAGEGALLKVGRGLTDGAGRAREPD